MAVIETQSYGSRLIESIKGVLFGVLLFFLSFPLLWWNEGRAVQTAKSLEEGAEGVTAVTALDPGNEGKLVHFTGQAQTDEVLSDRELGVSAHALRLEREVEMYQWREKSEARENVGGSKTTVYTYEKTWSDALISSANFKEAGHANPAQMRVRPLDEAAAHAKLGPFDLSPDILRRRVDKWQTLPAQLVAGVQTKLPADLHGRVKEDGDAMYVGDDPHAPAIGDCKVTFRIVSSPLIMSIVAQQIGRGFQPYKAKAGDDILLTAMEARDADAMFKTAEADNVTVTWALRAVGWFCMTLGLFLVMRPIAMVANFVPFAGSMVSFGAFVLAGAVSSALSLATVAVAWLFYRPLLGVAIFAAAGAALFLAIRMIARARRARAAG